jgi:hypothetical protein
MFQIWKSEMNDRLKNGDKVAEYDTKGNRIATHEIIGAHVTGAVADSGKVFGLFLFNENKVYPKELGDMVDLHTFLLEAGEAENE